MLALQWRPLQEPQGNLWGSLTYSSLNVWKNKLSQSSLDLWDFLTTEGQNTTASLVLRPWPAASSRAHLSSLSISSAFSPEAYWFLMFSISLSKGLISILQHHFRDNFSDQFSRRVLPSPRGVTHFWWQWIDYKETGECSAFWRLTRIRWGLDSSLMKQYLLNVSACSSIRNENDEYI